MSSNARPVQDSDEPAIRAAITKMLTNSPAPQMKHVDPEHAMHVIMQGGCSETAWVVGDYLVLVDVGSDWYSTERYLVELLILRISREAGNPVEDAINFLDVLKTRHHCVAIAAGDTQIGHMVPKYTACGFTVLGTQLYKE